MASSCALATVVVILSACICGGSLASTVVVGGSKGWRYGYNYTYWALKNAPFYINDTLVFKHGSGRKGRQPQPHSVYLLPNLYSYVKCDFSGAQLLASPNKVQGSGGFSYVLTQWRPQYFASRGADCNQGFMKFFAIPLPRF